MIKKLSEYKFPEELKTMSVKEMELLSYSIREFLIDKVSRTGGHLAPNLGVVELTLAMHKVFESPKDKFIWDVGHQSYVHKILTGRMEGFDSLRKFKGMSGFPKIHESEHDVFDTGHSSTSISVAAGIAAARDIKGENYNVIALIGDGAMTGGMSFEALNNLGSSGSKAIVILNDNGMSISKNIGGISQHLGNLRASKRYLTAKERLKKVSEIPALGNSLYSAMRTVKEKLKYALINGGVIFEELGFTYFGPVDGHNLEDLVEILEAAKRINGPVFIHVITKKGKGYINAEKEPNKFHGVGPFNKESGKQLVDSSISYSKVAGDTVFELAKENKDIVAISAAMCEATGLGEFSKVFPDRFFDVGIAEAHGVTFAAGLAKGGLKPVVAIYSTFLQRAFDQIIEDVCLMKLPVIFAIDRAGVVGADGETHHGIYDLAYLSAMPNMTIFAPRNGNQLKLAFQEALKINGPVAIRYPRGNCSMEDESQSFGNLRLSAASKVEILAVGPEYKKALSIAEKLGEKNISTGIVSVEVVKALDALKLEDFKLDTNENPKLYVTLEDHSISGGFGEKFGAQLARTVDKAGIINFAWPDKFIEHGDITNLEKKYGLDVDSITERICEFFEN